MKVIAAVDILGGQVVRLLRGDPNNKVVYSEDPIEIAKKWETEGADMLHVVDLDATLRTGHNNSEIAYKIIEAVSLPVQIAGGIRSIQAVEDALRKNAAKVVLGTLAFKEPNTIKQLAKKNEDRIVISIDQKDGIVMIDGWREPAGIKVEEAIKLFRPMGIREFLITSIDRDGTLKGPDLTALVYATGIADARIIASGGISSLSDIVRIRVARCSSVILGKALYDGKITIEKLKVLA
jgi:phosphoribosylformimino-5-aminoimidazole carboxamide ribotide isomerase